MQIFDALIIHTIAVLHDYANLNTNFKTASEMAYNIAAYISCTAIALPIAATAEHDHSYYPGKLN